MPKHVADRSSNSSPRTPVNISSTSHTHHHRTADELALQEAEEILESDDEDPTSPRALRYAELTRKRENSLEPDSTPDSGRSSGLPIGEGSRQGGLASSPPSASESDDDSDVTSDSDEESASDSESSNATSESDEDDEGDEELERQLAAARKAAAAKEARLSGKGAVAAEDDGELRFDEEVKEAPIPDLEIPALPAPVLALNSDGTAKATNGSASSSRQKDAQRLDSRAYERPLSKREKAAQPKKASVSEQWATIPAPRADDLPKMKRDYQALSLASSLDPKRFMKGQGKLGKVPERFNIGTMIEAPRHLQDTTVRKDRTYRAGQIVSSVVNDMEVGSYAKRKYEDLQHKRMQNGRGKGWQKRAKW